LERKSNEEEKGILQSRNQELQQELEALKVIAPKYTKCTAVSDCIVFGIADDHLNVSFQPALVHLA